MRSATYQFMQSREIDWLLMSVGCVLLLPIVFLHPSKWRSKEWLDSKPHPVLLLLSSAGTLCILTGVILDWF